VQTISPAQRHSALRQLFGDTPPNAKEQVQLQAGRVVRPQEQGHQGTSMGHSSARRKHSGPSDGDPVRIRGSQGRDSALVVRSRPSPSVGITRPAEGRGLGTRNALPMQGGTRSSPPCVATLTSTAITLVAADEPGGHEPPGRRAL